MSTQYRINNFIRSETVRLIGPTGENFGVLSKNEALDKAKEFDLDLVEISPNTNPPIAKIVDYGKFLYSENKKLKNIKAKTHIVEIKSIQIKIGTGDHDIMLKAKKTSEWLEEGHKVKVDLFLPGRTKYMDQNFIKERFNRFLNLISITYKVLEEAKKSPKGMTLVIEKA